MEERTFVWQRYPSTEEYLDRYLKTLASENPFLNKLALRLRAHAGARLFDWIDFLIIPADQAESCEELHFQIESEQEAHKVLHLPGSCLPRLIVGPYAGMRRGAAVKVDRIADFQAAQNCPAPIEGLPFSGFRRSLVDTQGDTGIFAVERRVAGSVEPGREEADPAQQAEMTSRYLTAWEVWMTRPRKTSETPDMEFLQRIAAETHQRAQRIVDLVGKEIAADVVMSAERTYWQAKNTIGRDVKFQLDQLGLGWANHDHHTFRCSRSFMGDVVRLMALIGFSTREKFYAGDEAGWGAQVMEHPAGFALFIDTDLDQAEIDIDFTRETLPKRNRLGTVGLWCRLHGESLFDAGLHHIAGRFEFREMYRRLSDTDSIMEPFSDFSYLKQSFTLGERWPVSRHRLTQLVKDDLLSSQQADMFTRGGALGSHLEIIERKEGFKGFNQQNVSDIISRTDPRENR